ncbi:MAG: folate-binding protein [Sedimenticola sp.]|jgi:hypothetical protein|nr:MAG: folate-binding protein [Sedimenticola sp.]
MNSEWKSFVESQPAAIDIDRPLPDCALFDLSHLSLTRISGVDAQGFLQGQFTNDVREVSAAHSQMSSFCTPKGRMLANFLFFMHGDDYMLQMPVETQAPLLKRLPMFILMSKVTVSDASDELVRIAIAGHSAPDRLKDIFSQVPARDGQCQHENGITLIRIPGSPARFEIVGEAQQISEIWTKLSETATPASPRHWELLDIRAGIPSIQTETIEAFVPQMVNMQLIDGVSFTKGCYTGQEVVARMKYLGKLKRQMFLAQVDTDQLPKPGDSLSSETSESGQGAGKVVNAQLSPDGGVELLAVVEISSREADDLHLGDLNGPRLKFRDLPYALSA